MEENKEKIEFTEELTIADLQIANYFNFRRQKRYLFNQIIFIGMSLLCVAFSIVEKEWVLLAIGVVLLIFSTLLFMPFYKKMIFGAVRKNMRESLNVKIVFTDENFIYTDVANEGEDIPSYEYAELVKGYDLPGYIYLYFNNSAIAIIKKDSCDRLSDLEELLKEKLVDKYEIINKVPR